MALLEYPRKGFIKSGFKTIESNFPFEIRVQDKKRCALINSSKNFFEHGVVGTWTMPSLGFHMSRLLVVHFYAVSAGYRVDVIDGVDYVHLSYRNENSEKTPGHEKTP